MESAGRLTISENRVGLMKAVGRGLRGRCPACGEGKLFGRFLKVRETCESCGLELHHHRADDLPPYLVIFLVGHLIGYSILTAETRFEAPLWFHLVLWPSLTLVLALVLLQPVKGAVVGLQYALGMHGFAPAEGDVPGAATSPLRETGFGRGDGTSAGRPPDQG